MLHPTHIHLNLHVHVLFPCICLCVCSLCCLRQTGSFSAGQELISAPHEKKKQRESTVFKRHIRLLCINAATPHPWSWWRSCSVFPRQPLLKLNLIVFYSPLFQMSARDIRSLCVCLSVQLYGTTGSSWCTRRGRSWPSASVKSPCPTKACTPALSSPCLWEQPRPTWLFLVSNSSLFFAPQLGIF